MVARRRLAAAVARGAFIIWPYFIASRPSGTSRSGLNPAGWCRGCFRPDRGNDGGRQLVGVQASRLVHVDYGGRGLDDRVEGAVATRGDAGPEARGQIVGVASAASPSRSMPGMSGRISLSAHALDLAASWWMTNAGSCSETAFS